MIKLQNMIRFIVLFAISLQTGITLDVFTATYGDGEILVEWEATTEDEIYGYILHRSRCSW